MTATGAGALPVGRAAGGENGQLAAALEELAALLERQGANPYRVRAYRHAADTVRGCDRPLRTLFDAEGLEGLDRLPGVGSGIASAIAEWLTRGRLSRLERLHRGDDPIELLRGVPGIGTGLAQRLHDQLGIETLEDLENAAQAGRLVSVPGLGPRRAAAIGAAVTQQLDRWRRRPGPQAPPSPPAPIGMLLCADRRYRLRAQAGELPTIAPRRLNPGGQAWLPVLHEHQGDWHVTALYSNTRRAHELGRTLDWVVLYAEQPHHAERRYTVVTETHGPLTGCRVVRGREAESAEWHRRHPDGHDPAWSAADSGMSPHPG